MLLKSTETQRRHRHHRFRRVGACLAAAAFAMVFPVELASTQTDHLVVYPMMKGQLIREAQYISDIASRASAAGGGQGGPAISRDEWAKLTLAAERTADAASQLSSAPSIDIIGEGDDLIKGTLREEAAARVQRLIAQNRGEFSSYAELLAAAARDIRDAGKARDVARLSAASERMDRACEACHLRFWYPATD